MSLVDLPEKVGDLIEVPPARRVVRLEEGREDPGEIAGSFVFTPEVKAHLTVISEALAAGRGQGYFLQGDFGSGKSHFLAALYAWLSGGAAGGTFRETLLGAANPANPVLPVAVSLVDYRSETPLEAIILKAVEAAITAGGGTMPPPAEDRKGTFLEIYQALEDAGFSGMILLIDELSEFLRSKPSAPSQNEDARTLQFLGEFSQDHPLWIIGAVQESIESTGDIAQAIIRKIKDRFPVKLVLSTVHIRALISGRLVRKKPGAEEKIFIIYEGYKKQFLGFNSSFDEFQGLYPVHPETIALLDGLGDLFSQHRGIVDFVCSRIGGDSRRNIPSILERPAGELLGPDSIFEHFSSRLAEFSAFNIYPRHIVPHLDKEIERIIEDGEDRNLAKRIIRILVLYRIHPAAETPGAGKLSELAACGLDLPELSARFVSEALLDPLAAVSRFLHRKTPPGGDPAAAIYEISTEEDSGKVLEARIKRLRDEIDDGDSRLLIEGLLALPESDSWPGPALAREGVFRDTLWNLSTRRAFVRFLHPEEMIPPDLPAKLRHQSCDFAFILTPEERDPLGETEDTAVWLIPMPEAGEPLDTLKEYLALRLLRDELSPSNPSDAPLIPRAAEREGRLKAAAAQAALEIFYSGRFLDETLRIDPAVRQLRRFESLLDAAGEAVLPLRYPRFREIAPRNYSPSPRIYQQLLENFVIPGALPVSQARQFGAAIDGLVFPLGLAEMKRGSYVFSPDISGHPLLISFFELLRPSGSVPLSGALEELEQEDFGLPRDTAQFLIASLAAGGLITVRRGGRALPLEYLSLQKIEQADEIALGELIGERDRATLLGECGFLSSTAELESFGIRQQRDVWKEVIAFRGRAEQLSGEVFSRLSQRREYSSFRGFPFSNLEEKLKALDSLAKSIRISYPAKEGLEKFLAAWRESGLKTDQIETLKGLGRFLKNQAEKFIFVHHYLRHEAAEKASQASPEMDGLRRAVLECMEEPMERIIPDGGDEFEHLFTAFRERYIPLYTELHTQYYESLKPPAVSKTGSRALEALRRLAAIESLDRPPGLDPFLLWITSSPHRQCGRQVREELMRSPVCGCGFLPGKTVKDPGPNDPEREIDRFLKEYLDILKFPAVLEALSGRGYAVRDIKPAMAAELEELVSGLRSGALSTSLLVGAITPETAAETAEALKGTVTLKKRDLGSLFSRLAGRRLPAETILELTREWLGPKKEGELIAVEGSESPADKPLPPAGLSWWAVMEGKFLPDFMKGKEEKKELSEALEKELEYSFPAETLGENLRRLGTAELLEFIRFEPFHTRAVRKAWQILAERTLARDVAPGVWTAAGNLLSSRHGNPERAADITGALHLLQMISAILERPFPGRLLLRPRLETLLSSPWCGEEIKSRGTALLNKTSGLGEEWLSGLSPVVPLDLHSPSVVIIMDAVPPDVWLACTDVIEACPEGLSTEWARLETEPLTVPATAHLLGVPGDPIESLEARGVPYLLPGAKEEENLSTLLRTVKNGGSAVIRLGSLDQGVHQGVYKLTDMIARLRHLLEINLPGLHRECREKNRALIITTDHGLTLNTGALGHGGGGVYERAIFRARWEESFPPEEHG